MTGESSGKWPESGAGDECMGLLKNLRREEILEVLSEGEGFCQDCQAFVQTRIHNLINKKSSELSVSRSNSQSSFKFRSANSSSLSLLERSPKSSTKRTSWNSIRTPAPVYSRVKKSFANSPPASVYRKQPSFHHSASEISLNDGLGRVFSLADNGVTEEQKENIRFARIGRKLDFVQVERIDGKAKNVLHGLELHTRVYSGTRKRLANSPPASVNRKRPSFHHSAYEISLDDGLSGVSSLADNGLSEEQEHIRFAQIGRKKDYVHIERIDGHAKNVLQGLELHTQVFNPEEQRKIVKYIYGLQRMGQNGQLRARTYSEPKKWMRGKGRVTIQFGCCYNYAVDRNGNPPGITRDEKVDPLPHLFRQMIKRMVRWHVVPPSCVPNSCIVNIYDEGDCIPPHIDHHDFLRPFCTVSLLTECNILFGANLKVISPGEFDGPVSIPLPVGSVLILNGNGADVAKHCVPGVPAERISITFRKMDDSKLPYSYSSDPDLMRIKPLEYSSLTKSPVQQNQQENNKISYREPAGIATQSCNDLFFDEEDDFSPRGSLNPVKRPRADRNGWRQRCSDSSLY